MSSSSVRQDAVNLMKKCQKPGRDNNLVVVKETTWEQDGEWGQWIPTVKVTVNGEVVSYEALTLANWEGNLQQTYNYYDLVTQIKTEKFALTYRGMLQLQQEVNLGESENE